MTDPSCTARRRILVADDNRDSAESLAALLRTEGYEVALAYDGAQAVSVFHAFQPDFAVLDIGMPLLNGYEVVEKIRGDSPGGSTTFIALTGWGQAGDKVRALKVGFHHHFTKPVDPQSLIDLLAQ